MDASYSGRLHMEWRRALLFFTFLIRVCHGGVILGGVTPDTGWGGKYGGIMGPDLTGYGDKEEDRVIVQNGLANQLRRFAESRALKTGTTIAGVVFQGGVVLGADTRATGGQTVCDRNCDKIHILAANIACCGAGTSADAERITEGVRIALLRMAYDMQACLPKRSAASSKLALSGMTEARTMTSEDGVDTRGYRRQGALDAVQMERGRVAAAAFLLKRHLFRYQGIVSAALVLGGIDIEGSHLYQIEQGGSFDKVQYTAMGSGSLAALSVLEQGYSAELGEDGAKNLVVDAIASGINNDLGSGSNIDICVITAEKGLEHHRSVRTEAEVAGETMSMGSDQATAAAAPDQAFASESRATHLGSLSKETNDRDGYDDGDGDGDDDGDGDGDEAPIPASGHGGLNAVGGMKTPDSEEWQRSSGMQLGLRGLNRERSETSLTENDDDDPMTAAARGSRITRRITRRRQRFKSVVRLDQDDETLRRFRCDALDDELEIL